MLAYASKPESSALMLCAVACTWRTQHTASQPSPCGVSCAACRSRMPRSLLSRYGQVWLSCMRVVHGRLCALDVKPVAGTGNILWRPDPAAPAGRPHQIRIHCAWIGNPLVGDPLYAAGGGICTASAGRVDGADDQAPMPGDTGYSLHSWQVQLRHPISGTLHVDPTSNDMRTDVTSTPGATCWVLGPLHPTFLCRRAHTVDCDAATALQRGFGGRHSLELGSNTLMIR